MRLHPFTPERRKYTVECTGIAFLLNESDSSELTLPSEGIGMRPTEMYGTSLELECIDGIGETNEMDLCCDP